MFDVRARVHREFNSLAMSFVTRFRIYFSIGLEATTLLLFYFFFFFIGFSRTSFIPWSREAIHKVNPWDVLEKETNEKGPTNRIVGEIKHPWPLETERLTSDRYARSLVD